MKIWRDIEEISEGKFLVVRRDGTIPTWPYFVIGARDPAAPAAVRAYAIEARRLGMDEEYVQSIFRLALDMHQYRADHGVSDPDAGPHRTDNPAVVALMRGEGDLTRIDRINLLEDQ